MTQDKIRNFSIIAHIDHGKTTLTDRLLMKTGTMDERTFVERIMDSNPIEKERGITIKMAPVSMDYQGYTLNLIDTPGHVDFSYEVSRSLAAVEGAILVVDATQGVQAQTLSHHQKTLEHDLKLIPVINKIDLVNADIEGTMLEMMELFGFHEDEFVLVSAKSGIGMDELLQTVIDRVPPPKSIETNFTRALIFSSEFNSHQGVVIRVKVTDGEITAGQSLQLLATQAKFQSIEVGVYKPQPQARTTLSAGEVGYIVTGLKDISLTQVGDTVTLGGSIETPPLPGYQPPQLMVFMDLYPRDGDAYHELLEAINKLRLHDAAIAHQPTHSPALGNGVRAGFLGILHAEIVQERLTREFNLDLVSTAPTVQYEVVSTANKTNIISNPADLPDPSLISQIREPMALVKIFTPGDYVGAIMQLTENYRGRQLNMSYFGNRAQITYEIPLAELITTYFDQLKSASQGYASLEYTLSGYQVVDAVKLSIMINHQEIDALSQIVVREKAEAVGRSLAKRLKEVIPRQLHEIPIQAAIGGKVVARETIKAFRKDVTAKLYGGDISRRKKLLEKQKKGKSKRGTFAKVDIPQEAFTAVLKRE
jgi:GTP-binding protein LepA